MELKKAMSFLRQFNAPADKKDIACPAIPKRRKIDGALRFSVLHPAHIGGGLGGGGCLFATFSAPEKVRITGRVQPCKRKVTFKILVL